MLSRHPSALDNQSKFHGICSSRSALPVQVSPGESATRANPNSTTRANVLPHNQSKRSAAQPEQTPRSACCKSHGLLATAQPKQIPRSACSILRWLCGSREQRRPPLHVNDCPPAVGGGVRIHPENARMSGRHGVQYVARCVAWRRWRWLFGHKLPVSAPPPAVPCADFRAAALPMSGQRLFFFFFTLVTGPRRSLSLKLSDTRVYEPQIL